MGTARLLDITRSILAQPTAPFHEDAVRAEILMQLAQCPHVAAVQDDFGNVIACYRRGVGEAQVAFAAHMDHPGYVGDEFLGGVPAEYRAKNPPLRDFGAFAMWDLPAFEVKDGRIFSRACDDLIGCTAIVALFHELEQSGAEACVYGLFTRAEEVGFIGAIRLAQSGRVPTTLTIISLETSSEKGGPAKMGAGVVVRVGDRTSVFDDAATAALMDAAKRAAIPVQRCLMSGGTCEATAYQLYGYRSAGLCVALGNYHNCGPDTQIASEYVSVEDVAGMVRLMVARTTTPSPADPHAALRAKLEAEAATYTRFTDGPV